MASFESVWEVPLSSLTIGFVGCGKISSAVSRGFASLDEACRPRKVLVSRRSEDKSSALAADFPALMEVCDANEDIVRRSDIVFIGLLPQVARDELPNLPFEYSKLVVSMMAAVGYEETLALTRVERAKLVRTVPLPSATRRSGPIVTFPPSERAEALLRLVGTPTPCLTEEQMKPMIAQTGHISSFYELMRVSQNFLCEQGSLPPLLAHALSLLCICARSVVRY